MWFAFAWAGQLFWVNPRVSSPPDNLLLAHTSFLFFSSHWGRRLSWRVTVYVSSFKVTFNIPVIFCFPPAVSRHKRALNRNAHRVTFTQTLKLNSVHETWLASSAAPQWRELARSPFTVSHSVYRKHSNDTGFIDCSPNGHSMNVWVCIMQTVTSKQMFSVYLFSPPTQLSVLWLVEKMCQSELNNQNNIKNSQREVVFVCRSVSNKTSQPIRENLEQCFFFLFLFLPYSAYLPRVKDFLIV